MKHLTVYSNQLYFDYKTIEKNQRDSSADRTNNTAYIHRNSQDKTKDCL